jgi:hypothetical protein
LEVSPSFDALEGRAGGTRARYTKENAPGWLARPTRGVDLKVSSLRSDLHLNAVGVGPAKGQNK